MIHYIVGTIFVVFLIAVSIAYLVLDRRERSGGSDAAARRLRRYVRDNADVYGVNEHGTFMDDGVRVQRVTPDRMGL